MEPVLFRRERLDQLRAVESEHFWFTSRRRLVMALAGPVADDATVVDVGCGSGGMLRAVAGAAHGVGIDRHPPTPEERGDERVVADAGALPIRDGVVDLVLALDVLEHVDDGPAAAELRRLLRPGGRAVVTVPAHRFLWSYRDTDAGHLRRYRRAELVDLLTHAGLRVEHASYFMAATFPVLALTRLLARGRAARVERDAEDRVPPRPLNALLTWLLTREGRHVARGGRLPFGSSIVAVAVAP